MDTPMHDKALPLRGEIRGALKLIEHYRVCGYTLAEQNRFDELMDVSLPNEAEIYALFGIDYAALEQEREALLSKSHPYYAH